MANNIFGFMSCFFVLMVFVCILLHHIHCKPIIVTSIRHDRNEGNGGGNGQRERSTTAATATVMPNTRFNRRENTDSIVTNIGNSENNGHTESNGNSGNNKENKDKAMKFMLQFGYLPAGISSLTEMSRQAHNDTLAPETISDAQFAEGIKDLQMMLYLPQTGIPDGATLAALDRPRCGVSDEEAIHASKGTSQRGRRGKRFYISVHKWKKRHLTYGVSIYPEGVTEETVDLIIAQAFGKWSDVTPLTFTHSPCPDPDIDIRFVAGSHGDTHPFDGRGGVMDHGYYPGPGLGGDAHIDADEPWADYINTGPAEYMMMFLHVFGHNLGLDHSSDPDAVMYPTKRNNTELSSDDILAIRTMYGDEYDTDRYDDLPINESCIKPNQRTTAKPVETTRSRITTSTVAPTATIKTPATTTTTRTTKPTSTTDAPCVDNPRPIPQMPAYTCAILFIRCHDPHVMGICCATCMMKNSRNGRYTVKRTISN